MDDLPRATKFATSRVWNDTRIHPRLTDLPLPGLPLFGSVTGILGLLGRRKGEKQEEEDKRKKRRKKKRREGRGERGREEGHSYHTDTVVSDVCRYHGIRHLSVFHTLSRG